MLYCKNLLFIGHFLFIFLSCGHNRHGNGTWLKTVYNPVDFQKIAKKSYSVFYFHTDSLFWSSFYVADDVQAVLHDVQDKTRLLHNVLQAVHNYLHDLRTMYRTST